MTWLAALAHATLEWMTYPSTWVAVLGPALMSAWALRSARLSRLEALFLAWGVLVTHASAELRRVDATLELHASSAFAMVLVGLVGLRLYVPSPLRAYALTWLVLFVSDLTATAWLTRHMPEVNLPVGIGGAGFADALFVEPLVVAGGVWLLALARARAPARGSAVSTGVLRLQALRRADDH